MAGGSFLRNVLRRAAIDEIDVHVIARGVPELGANPRPARAADRTED
jgi:hypothetical protein